MIGAYLSVSIVSLVVIGYHCNHLDGQLNWQVFTHHIIGGASKLSVVQAVICGMAHFHKASPGSDWLLFHSGMARMKITPRKEEKGKTRKVKTRVEMHAMPAEPPALAEPPVPTKEAPPILGKVERRRVEASRLEEVGRSLDLSPT